MSWGPGVCWTCLGILSWGNGWLEVLTSVSFVKKVTILPWHFFTCCKEITAVFGIGIGVSFEEIFQLLLLSSISNSFLSKQQSISRTCSILFLFLSIFETGFLCSLGTCLGTSYCSPGWPLIHRDSSDSAFWVLILKVDTTTAQLESVTFLQHSLHYTQ